jgi:hypothetical protein
MIMTDIPDAFVNDLENFKAFLNRHLAPNLSKWYGDGSWIINGTKAYVITGAWQTGPSLQGFPIPMPPGTRG